MSNQIDKHDFEVEKQKIKTFSENLPSDPTIERVGEGIIFGRWLTGEEANRITSQIQSSLISSNENIRKIIRELGTIYNTFEYLDKDYLAGIVASVQAAEAASEATKRNTEDIQKNLDALTKLVGKLKDFKQQTEENIISLLTQIDAVAKNLNARSNDIDSVRIHVRDLKDSINKANKKLSDVKSEIDKSLNSLEKNFLRCNGFIDKLRKQEHLHEIDLLWLSNQNLQMKVEKNDDEFATFVAKNEEMFSEVRQNLDKLWNNYQKNDERLVVVEREGKKIALRLYISYGIAIIAVALSIYNFFA